MAEKRYKQRKTSLAAKIIVVACASCMLVVGVGFGFASAGSTASHDIDSFGIDAVSTSASSAESLTSLISNDTAARENTVLASTASRDISQGIAAIEAEEEAARIAAEEAARAEEEARIAAAEAAQAATPPEAAALSPVDVSVGKEAFIAEWSARIDAYLAGSPLSGYGSTFAEAAWNYSVDPRFSPAISNTESSKGAVCFRPFNAWGWMSTSGWSSWEEAINAHVAGLANGYGYSITVAAAQKYCPPTYMDWYGKTLAQMQMI